MRRLMTRRDILRGALGAPIVMPGWLACITLRFEWGNSYHYYFSLDHISINANFWGQEWLQHSGTRSS